jgi:hypothetical protein
MLSALGTESNRLFKSSCPHFSPCVEYTTSEISIAITSAEMMYTYGRRGEETRGGETETGDGEEMEAEQGRKVRGK